MIRTAVVIGALGACGREPATSEPRAMETQTTVVSASAPAVASASAPPPQDAGMIEAKLFDAEGKLLPQTEEEPSTESALFPHHLDLLFRAIVADDPELARSFFFPREAYAQVKAIEHPERDWEHRLWKLFVRDIHDYHEQLGDDAERVKLVRFEPQTPRKQWMKPGSEGNRLGYWRMTRNQLVFVDGGGKERKLEVTSLISWRGEWYVVHLHGFK